MSHAVDVSTSADSLEATGAETPADALGVTKRMSTSSPQREESHECPSCDREFDTEYGVKQHHAKAHGESLAMSTVECDSCGQQFDRATREVENYDRHFCSRSCKSDWQSENTTGEENPNWAGGHTPVECVECGGAFKAKPSHADRRRFCSRDCYADWLSEHNNGENHPNHKEKVQLKCESCGCEYDAYPFQEGSRQFCSWECRNEWMTGETSPNWKGGAVGYYGPSWQRQRRAALNRDDHECRICGRSDSVHVHHIRPFRTFGVESHTKANKLSNLLTLCPSHHGRWEGIPLRPDGLDE